MSKTPRLVIVLPTYNERENIAAIVPAIFAQFKTMQYDSHILVVDDNSPDGTGDVVSGMMRDRPNLHLLKGNKQGLGAAYIRGMRHAMETLGADIIMEMDADFSHDPADLPRLSQALESGADFVIGSRYVPGGSIPQSWGWMRRANSRFGNVVARYIAGLYKVKDCTAGFRMIRSSVLKRINFDALRVKGYAFQIALLHQAMSAGARVVEIPVHFIDRTSGESKLGIRDIIEFMINAWWIRMWNYRTFLKFGVVGALGVVVNLAMFSLLLKLGMHQYIASPVAIEVSIIFNFLLNNAWTFRYRTGLGHVGIRGLKFNVVSFVSLIVSFVTFVVLGKLFPAWPSQVPQLLAVIPASVVNYFLNSYWTFKSKPQSETV